MRNKVFFYLVWDVLFFLQLYMLFSWGNLIKLHAQQTFEYHLYLWFQLLWMIVNGGCFCILAIKSGQYQTNRKSAVLEFILIGVPALYCATAFAFYFQISSLSAIRFPGWLVLDSMPATVCGILFGYELFFFLFRMFKQEEI